MINRDRELLNRVFDAMNELSEALEAYDQTIREEKKQSPDNVQLHRLLGLQQKRIGWIMDYLSVDGDEYVRDMADRLHVIDEARAGRFN